MLPSKPHLPKTFAQAHPLPILQGLKPTFPPLYHLHWTASLPEDSFFGQPYLPRPLSGSPSQRPLPPKNPAPGCLTPPPLPHVQDRPHTPSNPGTHLSSPSGTRPHPPRPLFKGPDTPTLPQTPTNSGIVSQFPAACTDLTSVRSRSQPLLSVPPAARFSDLPGPDARLRCLHQVSLPGGGSL